MERNRAGQLNIARDLLSQIAKNLLMGSSAVRKWRLKRPRTAVETENVDQFLKGNAFASLDLLLKHAGDLNGRSVCEIGAGDYLTSGLSILAAGASKYGVIDRFPGDYFGETAKFWYSEIEKNWDRYYADITWGLDASNFPENAGSELELIGDPLETAQTKHKYDIVCSFQVGEHISDINAFAEIHNRTLNKGGIGLHRVDFGPHDVWFWYRDPGTFLRFSDKIWNMTGSNRGVPNRKRHHEFIDAFERANLDVEVLYTDNFERSSMDLAKLNRKFREMPLDSVLTGTAIYRIKRRTNA